MIVAGAVYMRFLDPKQSFMMDEGQSVLYENTIWVGIFRFWIMKDP